MNLKSYTTLKNQLNNSPIDQRNLRRTFIEGKSEIAETIWWFWMLFAVCCQNILPLQIGFCAAISCVILAIITKNVHEETPWCALRTTCVAILGMAGTVLLPPFVLRAITIASYFMRIIFATTEDSVPKTSAHQESQPAKTGLCAKIRQRIDELTEELFAEYLVELRMHRWLTYMCCLVMMFYFFFDFLYRIFSR